MRIDRLCIVSFRTLVTGLWLLVLVCAMFAMAGCESRTFTAERPDGTVIKYNRVSIIGDSSSEGVSVSKQGDDLTVDVGPTNSQAKVEAVLGLIELLK